MRQQSQPPHKKGCRFHRSHNRGLKFIFSDQTVYVFLNASTFNWILRYIRQVDIEQAIVRADKCSFTLAWHID